MKLIACAWVSIHLYCYKTTQAVYIALHKRPKQAAFAVPNTKACLCQSDSAINQESML